MNSNYIKKKIEELEEQIASQHGDLKELKKQLHILQMQEFEEDLRESDNRQLLKG